MANERNNNEGGGEGEEAASSGGFTLIEFLLWLTTAIVADVFSIIPYVGVVVSWPFATFFLMYKWMKGLNFSKTIWVSVGDYLAEGVLSTLPANTADVIITYFLSKAVAVVVKTGVIGEMAATAAITAATGGVGGVVIGGAEAAGAAGAGAATAGVETAAVGVEGAATKTAGAAVARAETASVSEGGAAAEGARGVETSEVAKAAPEKPEVSGAALGEEPTEFEKLQKLFEGPPDDENKKEGAEEEDIEAWRAKVREQQNKTYGHLLKKEEGGKGTNKEPEGRPEML